MRAAPCADGLAVDTEGGSYCSVGALAFAVAASLIVGWEEGGGAWMMRCLGSVGWAPAASRKVGELAVLRCVVGWGSDGVVGCVLVDVGGRCGVWVWCVGVASPGKV